MIRQWDNIEFPICLYKDTGIRILASLDDIQVCLKHLKILDPFYLLTYSVFGIPQVLLDDHIIRTLTMRGSAFVKPCETEVRMWYDKLLRVNKLFEEWTNVQSCWLALLPLFSTEDIMIQMPNETSLFEEVDRIFCNNIKVGTAYR